MNRLRRSETTEDGRRRDRRRPPAPEPLPLPVTDTHCHMDIADGDGDNDGGFGPEEALAAAERVGVSRVVQVGVDLPTSGWAVEAAERFSNVVATVAVHPNEAPRLAAAGELDATLAEIDRIAGSSDRVRGVGESGLDHFRTGPDGYQAQEESFRAHIEIARRRGLALAIHDRDAHDEILRVLDDVDVPDRVIFHCFSGDAAMARHCAERGWFLSFAGTVTFKNADALRAALREAPLEQILVETDAPYLTPHPYRGRPNASYLVPLTVRAIAEVLDRDLESVCATIQENTDRAFETW
ncbi:TatD family deoxyribonuclease [Actinobacteria bacterium YIM 96077]|uniref:AraC family transcriptional regulator n=1 Tax=Phytoactinopolyspora halophila TaxID=1981511 RepID=A0A329QLS5_9ACTN|nr:TatD family hydrolase [Phytoactinopolyspora halophila]AYY15666.1 TatD family deoxyribonuclease [Actinobacteria bacterium YIM 96077]RAW11498.1 AraC family transcriptional regulator [Phytoactinopolyspora halophila]